MKILFDHGTPAPLRVAFAGHEVETAFEKGWSALSNGELLRKAEAEFDVFITTDKNLRYQQISMTADLQFWYFQRRVGLEIQKHQNEIAAAVEKMQPGLYTELNW